MTDKISQDVRLSHLENNPVFTVIWSPLRVEGNFRDHSRRFLKFFYFFCCFFKAKLPFFSPPGASIVFIGIKLMAPLY